MKTRISMILLVVILLVPKASVANGDNTTQTNQELTTTANVYLNSTNSTVGEVRRWKDIGYQSLINLNTGETETFDEYPKVMYPWTVKWYNKEVKVYATIEATFKPIRNVAFRADARVNGRVTSDDSPQTINEPLTKVEHEMSNVLWIDTSLGEQYKARGHTATVTATATSKTYTLTKPMTVSVYADGQGDAVPGTGGGFSFNIPIYKDLSIGFGLMKQTHPAPSVDRLVKTDRASDSLTIKAENESPPERYCICPLTPAFWEGICYAKMDTNNMYNVPTSTYHRFYCNLYNSACGNSGNPACFCGSGPPKYTFAERWVCYNTDCGPRTVANHHALLRWYYPIMH